LKASTRTRESLGRFIAHSGKQPLTPAFRKRLKFGPPEAQGGVKSKRCVCVQCRLLKKQACRACQGCKEAVPENKELMPHQVVMLTYLPHNNQPARSIPCYTSFAPPAKSHDLRCFACIMGNVGMRLGSFEKQALSFLDVCNSICTAQKHICR
jgi:hypothetical protein